MARRAHDYIGANQVPFADSNLALNRSVDMDIHVKGRIVPHHDKAAFSSEKRVLPNADQAFKSDRMRRNEFTTLHSRNCQTLGFTRQSRGFT